MDVKALPLVVERALATANAVERAAVRHSFARDSRAFARVLTEVPDSPAREFSSEAMTMIQTLAEGVIARIEKRLDTMRDRERVKVDLAESVYDIRRALEEIDSWARHFRT